MTPTLEKLPVRMGGGHTCRGRLRRASALREGSRRDGKPRGEPSAVKRDGREGFLGVSLSRASKVKQELAAWRGREKGATSVGKRAENLVCSRKQEPSCGVTSSGERLQGRITRSVAGLHLKSLKQ